MKRTVVVTLALIFAAITAFAEDAQPAGSGQEIVVKGQLKIKIQAEKPDTEIKTEINEVADKVIRTEDTFLTLAPEDIKDVKTSLPATVYRERADYHPELGYFEEAPIFSLKPKIQNVDIDKWNFKVTDLAGNTVRQLKGNGALPEQFLWDGFDDQGNIMKLGSGYSYRLYYMDKAGNPNSINRNEPKTVTAIKYRKDGLLYLEVSTEVLFQAKRKEKLTDEGRKILEQVKDYIKMSNAYPVEIRVFAEDAGLAEDQILTLNKAVIEELKLPAANFKSKAARDESVPKNRRVVFVIKG